jgi:hypothetical protein
MAYSTATEVTRREVEIMTDETLGAAVVDDLKGLQPVAPTSHCPNVNAGILDGQQRNADVVVIKPVPPHNVLEIPVDKVAQPP